MGCAHDEKVPSLPTGTVVVREIAVSSKIPERIVKLHVTEGDQVVKGQVVAELDKKDLLAKEKQALASMEAARTQIEKAQTALKVKEYATKASLERANAVLQRAESEATLAKQTLERMEALFMQQAISQQQLDEARARAGATQAAVSEARAGVNAAEAAGLETELVVKEIEAAQAQYEQAKATIEELRNNLEELTIKAPAPGTVTAVNLEEGELAPAGKAIISLTDFDDTWVELQVNQDVAQTLQLNQKVAITAGGKIHSGKIVKIGNKPHFATRKATTEKGDMDIITYEVRIKTKETSLLPGMNVKVDLNYFGNGGEKHAS